MKLDGIRVIDLSRFLPGPMLTQFMADQGAEVIKIESVDEGEPTRGVGGRRDGSMTRTPSSFMCPTLRARPPRNAGHRA